jgi:hypothetical protein
VPVVGSDVRLRSVPGRLANCGLEGHRRLRGRHSTGYPFFGLVALVWAPITAYLTVLQYRSQVAWTAGAAFTVSIFVLIAIARVFQESYIIYPLSGLFVGLLLALDERAQPTTASP